MLKILLDYFSPRGNHLKSLKNASVNPQTTLHLKTLLLVLLSTFPLMAEAHNPDIVTPMYFFRDVFADQFSSILCVNLDYEYLKRFRPDNVSFAPYLLSYFILT